MLLSKKTILIAVLVALQTGACIQKKASLGDAQEANESPGAVESSLPSPVDYERFVGKTFEIRSLKKEIVDKETMNIHELIEDSQDDIFLGVMGGHFYLLAGDVRAEAVPFSHLYVSSKPLAKDGFLFRFSNLPAGTAQKMVDYIKSPSNDRYLSCVNAATRILEASVGIKIRDPGIPGPYVFLSNTFFRILDNGFVDAEGKKLPYQLYRTHDLTIAEHFEIMKGKDVYYSIPVGIQACKVLKVIATAM